MIRKLAATTVAGLLALATASPALCADIVGTVRDTKGHPVAGVQITAQKPAGRALAQALTDREGKYRITGLNPGRYDYALNPLQTGFRAGTAVAYLDSKGLTLDWKVSKTASAIALATPGTTAVLLAGDPFGLSTAAFAAALVGATGVVAGGVVGGIAAAGGFSSAPASPSR